MRIYWVPVVFLPHCREPILKIVSNSNYCWEARLDTITWNKLRVTRSTYRLPLERRPEQIIWFRAIHQCRSYRTLRTTVSARRQFLLCEDHQESPAWLNSVPERIARFMNWSHFFRRNRLYCMSGAKYVPAHPEVKYSHLSCQQLPPSNWASPSSYYICCWVWACLCWTDCRCTMWRFHSSSLESDK